MFALADCNNFFVSCERAFQPALEGKAVVVLSNNDGCVVARSNESKALGIKMGTPFFQIRDMVDRGEVVVRSSNYTLYGDLSRRVMAILAETFPVVETYSIDEAFLPLEGMDLGEVPDLARRCIRRIRRCTGIPVSIGIAPTRTLAKIANHFAKRHPGYGGVCAIDSDAKRMRALELTPIDDVWGIGWRNTPKLQKWGVQTAAQFRGLDAASVYKAMGVCGLRTWKELGGECAIARETAQRRQSICTSRSFADMISDIGELERRVSDFAAICARKLRDEGSAAHCVSVFLYSNPFRKDLEQHYPTIQVKLDVACNSTEEIVGAALEGLHAIYKEGVPYKKAGVVVHDIVEEDGVQGVLFDYDASRRRKAGKLSEVMDSLNGEDRHLLRLAVQRPGHYADGIRREHCSKPYSTSWDDMIEVH